MERALVTSDPWRELRTFTGARIALGRAGGSLPTGASLELRLAQARARDAVHAELASPGVAEQLENRGYRVLTAHSAAANRRIYLLRPDLGRRLDGASRQKLKRAAAKLSASDAVFVLADGLSAAAIERHAAILLDLVIARLVRDGWTLAPIVVVRQGRVAVGDEITRTLNAEMAAVLIGERPGLSAPDSLGVYLTWQPRPGVTDAQRNCISNIRPEGLPYQDAARTLVHLMCEARRLRVTGVQLSAPGAPARLKAPD